MSELRSSDDGPPTSPPSDRLLSPAEASSYVGLKVKTLGNLRCSGGGPPYVKLSRSRVGYLLSDLNGWLRARRVCSSTEAWARELG